MNTHQVRKLPKKSVITISIMIIIIFSIFYVIQDFREQKIAEALSSIGHKNIKNLKVINKLEVEDAQTRYKSTVYKILFYDNDLEQSCIGFLHKERNQSYTKDFNCK
jgi:membrane-associated HD superfamily phosphohydrolase